MLYFILFIALWCALGVCLCVWAGMYASLKGKNTVSWPIKYFVFAPFMTLVMPFAAIGYLLERE